MMMSDEEYDLPPLDIVIEIMKRLPIKSLIKFMSVSKQWKSVIQSSPFISDYNNIQPPSSSNLFFAGFNDGICAIVQNKLCKDDDDHSSNQQLLTLPDSDDFRDFNSYELIGYSQGLFGFFISKDRLVIWNPSIRKSVFIPLPPDHAMRRYDDFCFTVVCNAIQPTIFNVTDTPRLQLQIYTLPAGAWRTVSNTPPPRGSLRFTGEREVTDRFIYWIACDDDSSNYVILSFDITSERFTELCLPPTLAAYARDTYLHLSKLRESLVVLETHKRKQVIGVWVMESGSFTKEFTINLPGLPILLLRDDPGIFTNSRKIVLGFTKDGQPILLLRDYPSKCKLLFYEPDSKSFRDIGFYEPDLKSFKNIGNFICPNLAGSYVETLLLLDR